MSITPIAVPGVDALVVGAAIERLMSPAQLGSGSRRSILSQAHESGGTIGHGAPSRSLAQERGLLAATLMNRARSRRARGGAASQRDPLSTDQLMLVPGGGGSGYSIQQQVVGDSG